MSGRPLVLGLVGSVCAGKSTVAAELERLGARVHRADEYVHELLRQQEVISEVAEAFGSEVLDEARAVDRKKLGAMVFADPDKLSQLEGILHPRTGAKIRELVAETKAKRDVPLLVIDAPLLIEAGRHKDTDRLLVVGAPLENRRAWAAESRGWDASELARREDRLMPIEEKRERADFVIENDGDKQMLIEKVGRLWKELI